MDVCPTEWQEDAKQVNPATRFQTKSSENPDLVFHGLTPRPLTIGFHKCNSLGRDNIVRGIGTGSGKREMDCQVLTTQCWQSVDWFRILNVKCRKKGQFIICPGHRTPWEWLKTVNASVILTDGWCPLVQDCYGKHDLFFPMYNGERLCWIPNHSTSTPYALEVCVASPLYRSECNGIYIAYYKPRWYWEKPDCAGSFLSDDEPASVLETRTMRTRLHDSYDSDGSSTEKAEELEEV